MLVSTSLREGGNTSEDLSPRFPFSRRGRFLDIGMKEATHEKIRPQDFYSQDMDVSWMLVAKSYEHCNEFARLDVDSSSNFIVTVYTRRTVTSKSIVGSRFEDRQKAISDWTLRADFNAPWCSGRSDSTTFVERPSSSPTLCFEVRLDIDESKGVKSLSTVSPLSMVDIVIQKVSHLLVPAKIRLIHW